MRTRGWQARLSVVIHDAAKREFDALTWNCARFAHACAQAVSEREIPYRWLGSLEGSVDAVLPRIGARLADVGDVVLALLPEPTLGVCCGRDCVFLGDNGLMRLPVSEVSAAWRVE